MKEKLEPIEPIADDEDREYTKKDKIIFASIYCSIFILLPAAIGLPLTFGLKTPYYVDAIFMIFGSVSILAALFRSYRRDSTNYRKNHTVVEDKDSTNYKIYSFHQLVAYIAGAISLGIGVGLFYLLDAIGLFAQ